MSGRRAVPANPEQSSVMDQATRSNPGIILSVSASISASKDAVLSPDGNRERHTILSSANRGSDAACPQATTAPAGNREAIMAGAAVLRGPINGCHLTCLLVILSLLTACAGLPRSDDSDRARDADQPKAVAYALSLRGVPYRYGGESPASGFDCSGFVRHVYARQGILLPRSASQMGSRLAAVRRQEMRPGDLVFFDIDGRFSHVGIYVGGKSFVHAPSRRTGRVSSSRLDQPYWRTRFSGVRRPRSISAVH
jgi:hypothetical protein